MFLRTLVAMLIFALPLCAEPICDPPKGTLLSVSGVAWNDTLNMRSGPDASNRIVSRIKPDETGVTATGRSAWAKGQCAATCEGEEGGLNDKGRSIAYGCKANGQIWYEVRRKNGDIGWASAKFLTVQPGGGVVTKPSKPVIESKLTFSCGANGKLVLAIHKGGKQADVTIGGKSYRVDRHEHLVLKYFYVGDDGARLRGGSDLIEWRWPNGTKTACNG